MRVEMRLRYAKLCSQRYFVHATSCSEDTRVYVSPLVEVFRNSRSIDPDSRTTAHTYHKFESFQLTPMPVLLSKILKDTNLKLGSALTTPTPTSLCFQKRLYVIATGRLSRGRVSFLDGITMMYSF